MKRAEADGAGTDGAKAECFAVQVKGVTKKFTVVDSQGRRGRFTALDSVSLEVRTGEWLVVGGANGSGKSLLMHLIARLESPTAGEIITDGRVGLVFQDADSQILGETPREDVLFSLKNNQGAGKTQGLRRSSSPTVDVGVTRRKVLVGEEETFLDRVGLLAKADFPSRQLSGGEKRRLAVAGVLAQDAQTIIFDEPYANLDYPGVLQVNTLMVQLHREGKTIILLTHELEKCLGFSDHFAVLYKGRKVLDCTPTEGLRVNLALWGIHPPGTELEGLVWE